MHMKVHESYLVRNGFIYFLVFRSPHVHSAAIIMTAVRGENGV